MTGDNGMKILYPIIKLFTRQTVPGLLQLSHLCSLIIIIHQWLRSMSPECCCTSCYRYYEAQAHQSCSPATTSVASSPAGWSCLEVFTHLSFTVPGHRPSTNCYCGQLSPTAIIIHGIIYLPPLKYLITWLLQTSPQNTLFYLTIMFSPPSDTPHLWFNFSLTLVRYQIFYITLFSYVPCLSDSVFSVSVKLSTIQPLMPISSYCTALLSSVKKAIFQDFSAKWFLDLSVLRNVFIYLLIKIACQ